MLFIHFIELGVFLVIILSLGWIVLQFGLTVIVMVLAGIWALIRALFGRVKYEHSSDDEWMV